MIATGPPVTTLAATTVVTGDRVLQPGWVTLRGDRIEAVGPGAPPAGPPLTDLGDAVVVPGFVDQHVHGGGGASFGGGVEQALAAASFHRSHGTTTIMASLVTEAPDVLLRQVSELAPLVRQGDLAGIHLEGPWLARQRCGAHDPGLLRPPDPAEVAALLAAADQAIGMVTIAPELPGALDTIRRLVGEGVRVAIGHTDATYEQVLAGIDAGATVATHLFNAMPGIHHRRPGPVVALLSDPGVVVELIADGTHLDDAVLALAVSVAGAARVALVTDAISAAGAGDGEYRLGPLRVRVRDGVARLDPGGAIAGSTLTTDDAFARAARITGDLVAASVMSSYVPAGVLGVAADRGALRPGLRADLVVMTADLRVDRVMRAGAWL